jgi:hypothetical protein
MQSAGQLNQTGCTIRHLTSQPAMFTLPFLPRRFLRTVYGTAIFIEYCRERAIPFTHELSRQFLPIDALRWAAALAELPREQCARVEMELATVNEMSSSDAVAHLLETAGRTEVPPDDVPRGAPLALWFCLRHPGLFRQVFLYHELQELDSWRTATATPGLALADLEGRRTVLAKALHSFFQLREGTGRFCAVDVHRLGESVCLIAQIADRLRFIEAFSESGEPTLHRLRPSLSVLFVYYPADGTVLLKSHLRAADRISGLLRCFGEAVLQGPVTDGGSHFDLERLKLPFHPLPDADDMELVRVKALHLRYPERLGRRQLKLETRTSDEPTAIEELLRSHVDTIALSNLRVCHAQLQVRLRFSGETRNYLVRLWPNRCNLNQTVLGDRFRSCLKRWGLLHASQP